MNRFQAKLIKNNPSLFKKEIKKLYHEGKLESSLTLIYSSKIIKVLEEEKIYLKIDNLTRMSLLPLLEDSLFVDYILKHHIECLPNIPDKLLKDEYFKQYAMYLKNNDIDITTIKSKLLVHHEIANVVLLKINSLNDLEYFLDNVNDDNLLLKAIIIGEEKKLLNDNISEVFYKNATIFRKMLKIYGNKLLTKTTEEKLKEFIPIIADEIINNNLILNSNNVFLLKEPEIIKAILNSPNILKMPDIINCLIDINTLNENELISLTELIYYNFHHDPFTFAFISIDFLKNPLILKKMLFLNHLDIIKEFRKDAFDEENIKLFSDKLINNESLITIINTKLNHPYYINTLSKMLKTNYNSAIFDRYFTLAIENEDENALKEGIHYLKEDNNFSNYIKKSSFLLKNLINLKEISLIKQMNVKAFTNENVLLLFDTVSFKEFVDIIHPYDKFYDFIRILDIKTKEEYLRIFNDLQEINDKALIIYFIKKYNDSNLDFLEVNEIRDYLYASLNNKLKQKLNDSNSINTLLEDILSGKKSYLNLNYLNDRKSLYYATYIADIDSVDTLENIGSIPLNVLEKMNKKHLREILSLLDNYSLKGEKILLACNIYLSIGYERAKDLLNPNANKNYGQINSDVLKKMFLNIKTVDIEFKKEGNGYVPVLNEEWIKLIFGENYKIKNTPIRNYLNNFQDKKDEIKRLKLQVDNNLNLTVSEKNDKKSDLDRQYSKYVEELKTFISLCSSSFNEWDIILEEFFKSSNSSKLKSKLNIAKINEILKLVKNKRNLPELEVQDELLFNSDVFNYVGYDNQYTVNPELAPKRAVHISRNMHNYQKKFPNIKLKKDDLILEVYNPQDRRILSAGYRSKCCFRPNGNADNSGKDNSLLFYCATKEYGGGLEIKNKEGETIMFSPILRNGNVLMIHSIETKGLKDKSSKVHELLKEYAEQTILESTKNDDDISFVTITDLHYLDKEYTIGYLPMDKKFKIYKGSPDMYNNLDQEHYILAKKENKHLSDIKYNKEVKSYDYPKQTVNLSISVTKEEQQMIMNLQKEYSECMALTNERYQALKENDEDKSYELLVKINEKKKIYLSKYQEILKRRKGRDLFKDYMASLNTIKRINEELKINIDEDFIDINMGNDWYIAYDNDGNRYAYALESGQEQLQKELMKINNLEDNKEIKL